ncbi:ketopantoate reductase family protein [Chloroflexota bacterium]
MRIAVVGMGGVGGYYGGCLAHRYPPGSEHEVFFCRGAHLAAIQANGLRVEDQDGEFVAVPSLATDSVAELGAVDVALYCVKGYDLASVAEATHSTVTANTVVVPLGNGVNNDDSLKRSLDGPVVLNGCVYISSHIEAPGVIEQTGGSRKLFFGVSGDVESYRVIESMLQSAGIDATLTSEILQRVWTKFLFIDASCGVTSLHDATIGQVLDGDSMRGQLTGLMEEVAALATQSGVTLPEDVVVASLKTAASFSPAIKTSMQIDFERGSRTELDVMLGYVVRTAREASIPTPVHDEVYTALSSR